MDISWSQIDPKEFEQLCYLILEANNFSDIQWFGEAGSDKGRDIIAKKVESPLLSVHRTTKWVVQCKRYISKPPKKEDLASFLVAAREHKPDNVLIMVTNTLSPNTKDWLDSVRGDYQFQIYLWEELDLRREIHTHKRHISERFPRIYGKSDPIFVYHLQGNEIHFVCNEFEEILIVVINKNAANRNEVSEARKDVAEFIQFLKQNEIDFDWPTKPKGNT
jgi:hypothetical protein